MTDAGARAREAHEAAREEAINAGWPEDEVIYSDAFDSAEEQFEVMIRAYLAHMASAGFKLVHNDDRLQALRDAAAVAIKTINTFELDGDPWISGYHAASEGIFEGIVALALAMHDAAPALPPEEGR